MIKNSHEFELTSSSLGEFLKRKEFLETRSPSKEIEIEIKGINAITHDLSQQIQIYQDILDKKIQFVAIESLQSFPDIVVGKRIQTGLSQAEFAAKLGLEEDEYLYLENNDFYAINPTLFIKMLEVLDLKNPKNLFVKDYETIMPVIENNINKIQVAKSYLPVTIQQIKKLLREKSTVAAFQIEKTIELFKGMFAIDVTDDDAYANISSNLAVAFKHRVNVDVGSLNYSTGFAAYIARIFASRIGNSTTIKADPISIRESILSEYGSVNFNTCLKYIWKLNIIVIPLNMRGSFHGACFDFEDTKSIMLNQQNKTISRWKFDLLHEFYHALTMKYSAYIERTDIMDSDDEEERTASEFASYVIFGQEMESFLKLVIERSDGQVERVKNNVVSVAEEYGLNIDDFANYVAFRISREDVNFWGTAANLQIDRRNPFNIVLEHLNQKISNYELSQFEIEVLQKAFYTGGD